MAKNNNLTDFLTDIADTLRTKKNSTDLINPQNFSSEINELIHPNEILDKYSYGVEWNINNPSPECTRIGNLEMHKTLPIQSAYRGCLWKDGKINYYLDANNWNYKEDGTPSILDGTDGTVRIEIPRFFGRSWEIGDIRQVRISTMCLDETWQEIPHMVIDAYRFTVDRTNNLALSIVNTDPQFRGGSNSPSYDQYLETDIFRTQLGKPATALSRDIARTYATNAKSELLCYEFYKWIFYWNYVIEYANFNCQLDYNPNLTADGYRQGGLGAGVTNMADQDKYNGYYPITPCGYGNEFGNNTGIKSIPYMSYVVDETTYSRPILNMVRWRGFDNPFGDIWTSLDGVVCKRDEANTESAIYTTSNSLLFDDTINNKQVAGYEIASEGYIKTLALGNSGEIIPSSVGADTITYKCDYHHSNPTTTSLRTLIVGGRATANNRGGINYFNSEIGTSDSDASIGFRSLTRL